MQAATYAVLFFDVDGTIIYHPPAMDALEVVAKAHPTPAVRDAFLALRDNGHKTFICTGRPLCLVSQSLLDLAPAGLITGAGSCVSVDGRVVKERVIPLDVLEGTVDRLTEVGASVIFEGTEGCVTLVPGGGNYPGNTDIPVARNFSQMRELSNLRFNKFSYESSQLEALKQVDDFCLEHYIRFDLGIGYGEYGQKGIDKGWGVRQALEILGHGVENTYAFGDSENDLPMLQVVETPVAMGNALESIKEASAYITDSVQDDGVATACRHFGLI